MDRTPGTIKTLLLDRYHRVLAAPHDPEWDDRATFLDWCIMRGFEPGMELRRRDTAEPYGPQNCVWVWDAGWAQRWNHTVNVLRQAAGLPLFPE